MKLTNLKDKNQFKFFMASKKSDLRQQLKQKRQNISAKTHQALSQIIVEKIQTQEIFKKALHIGIYYPIHAEVDVLGLLKNQDKTFYLPHINSQNMLEFRQVKVLKNLVPNQWGIPEPKESHLKGIPSLLIIPMLGFDIECHRLGYGKGYYDRFLGNPKKPLCLGVAFDFQQTNNIPHESHDINMDLIITDKKIVCNHK